MSAITEEQVEQFMREAAARLAEKCGESYASVSVTFNNDDTEPEWKSYVHGGRPLTGGSKNCTPANNFLAPCE